MRFGYHCLLADAVSRPRFPAAGFRLSGEAALPFRGRKGMRMPRNEDANPSIAWSLAKEGPLYCMSDICDAENFLPLRR